MYRSLPDLELITESSLLSILRWNYKVNMDKTMCSDDNGQIVLVKYASKLSISLILPYFFGTMLKHILALWPKLFSQKHATFASKHQLYVDDNLQANGSELAFISLLAGENEFRYLCYSVIMKRLTV